MKYLGALLVAASAVSAGSILKAHPQVHLGKVESQQPVSDEQYLIELSPGDTEWVTEDKKWEYRRVGSFLYSGAF